MRLHFSEAHPGRAARIEGDAALLRRMLDNLIRNSITHNPQGCHISVTVRAEDGRCTCAVTDDGKGMDARPAGCAEPLMPNLRISAAAEA